MFIHMHFEGNVYLEPELTREPQTESKILKGIESQRPLNVKNER